MIFYVFWDNGGGWEPRTVYEGTRDSVVKDCAKLAQQDHEQTGVLGQRVLLVGIKGTESYTADEYTIELTHAKLVHVK